jgi:DNA invertase Pin-like site-specific DNA recombinase
MTTPAGTGPRTAAIWARVSTDDQHTDNQLHVLRQWAAARGFEVTAEFVTEDSAWSSNGGKGKEYERQREALIRGAHLGQYKAVLIWALDRLGRRGYRDLDAILERLAAYDCDVLSHQEDWLTNLGPYGEIVRHMLALNAEQESSRRSERIKAGLARVKREIEAEIAAGKTPTKHVGGGQRGRKDRKRRRTEGYEAAWAPGGSRRQAHTEALTPEQQEEARAMYAPGPDGRRAHTQPQIAAHFGVTVRQLAPYLPRTRKPRAKG